ncbi:hypothetical protein KAFR_0C05070 [Kazachstania africana CBS 2517]|uniref:Electron transfer flavoprotein-ubiquinone oxidoreductase n=1 Tax=Kazachstania africana (strain ATCC 22294 / BCRC 22015 / CBS 2517 / CECT 1963 / NBRC 1671 / NRRL Y-8276) TaxID=1071382 RepID=H2ASZ8_KAZAF|nr:hypothetical protein KAFR_0C05070 [Kazachstania africana CBS 2517]CCF57498.1 hypothetical protein KAFR_0C05070 [Kazachstania africana CBS 2517]
MILKRFLSSVLNEPRAKDLVDLCIVGGGPAGLATAIRFKQLDKEMKYRVVLLEKGSEVGSHTVSGLVLDPKALKELFPEVDVTELLDKVTQDELKLLTSKRQIPLPVINQMQNKGKNFVGSLNNLVRWLGQKAEEIGVEIYPSVSVSDIVYNKQQNGVIGVATRDLGISKEGKPKDNFEKGMEFHSRQTIFAEGCRGSLTKQLIKKFSLNANNKSYQTYGLGIKEIWKVQPEKFHRGKVSHTLGYPLSRNIYGGGFQYHFGDNLVAVGLVIGLDYENPYISPYMEFQKLKHHPYYAEVLTNGECLSYAARAISEGGYQAIPRLTFPGGLLVGDSAGFLNVPRIKGTHTAMKSGIIAAENCFKELSKVQPFEEDSQEDLSDHHLLNIESYESDLKQSWIYKELESVRNIRPSFNTKLGLYGGLLYSGIDSMLLKGRTPWTFQFGKSDALKTMTTDKFKPIKYPKPDNKISFDIMTSVSRTGTYHDDNESCHLRVGSNQDLIKYTNEHYRKWGNLEGNFCPAGVYEYVADDSSKLGVKFKINSQNCIHCKTCDIKAPKQDINWIVPEGGDGPKYTMT